MDFDVGKIFEGLKEYKLADIAAERDVRVAESNTRGSVALAQAKLFPAGMVQGPGVSTPNNVPGFPPAKPDTSNPGPVNPNKPFTLSQTNILIGAGMLLLGVILFGVLGRR